MEKTVTTISMILGLVVASGPALAEGSVQHFSQALNHSAQAVGFSAVAGAQLASAVIAVPLVAAGAVGAVSGQAGHALLKASGTEIGKPLSVSNVTITAGPTPAKAVFPNR